MDASPQVRPGRCRSGAARAVAALVAGFGGLAFEIAVLRRLGLVLGNTAEAAAGVVAAFLCGLGVGGFVASRLRGPRGLAGAAAFYAATAMLVLASDPLVGALGPVGAGVGTLATMVLVGLPAVAMGIAFPLLFDGLDGRRAPGVVVALNLAGSVAAAWIAGNQLVPLLGLSATHRIGGACYVVAAAAAAFGALGRGPVTVRAAPAPGLAPHLALAFGAGLLVLGFEVLLLRRLPFFLEGFQPTMSGVLAACLLALAAGAALGPVLARGRSARAAGFALVLAALGACLGLHERLVPVLGRLAVQDDAGLHLRILGAALVASAPALVCAGAVVPLCLGSVAPGARGRAAGLLFLAQGAGSFAGAVLVGHALPLIAPSAFFAVVPAGVALLALVAAARVVPGTAAIGGAAVVVLALLGVAGAGSPLDPTPPVRGSRFDRPSAYRPIAHRTDAVTTASVVYDRAHHSMVLFTDEFRAAYTGPGTSYMKVLGHLPFLLRDGLREVAVIALGTGTTADAVRAWPDPERIHVVEISPAVLSLVDHFAGDGPVPTGAPAPFRADPRTIVHVADGRRWLARREPGTLDLVTMEPLLPYAPGTAALYSAEFYQRVREALRPDGLCVQWVPTHAMPRAMFETLLATFADAFPATSVWLIDQSTLLVGSAPPHMPALEELEARLQAAPPLARRTLHEAGIATSVDLLAAHVGVEPLRVLDGARRLTDDRPFLERIGYWSGIERLSFLPDNLAVLDAIAAASLPADPLDAASWIERRRERLAGLAARSRELLDPTGAAVREALGRAAGLRRLAPRSVLLHHEETLALRAAIRAEVLRMPLTAAAPLARRHVLRDLGSAPLLAISGADQDPEGPAAQAALLAALAVDPTAPETAPWAFAWAGAAVPDVRRSPLEDVAVLPDGAALVALAARQDARGLAVRAAFGVRAGIALAAAAERRALTSAERAALHEVADPVLLDRYAAAVAARGGDLLAEVVPVWRRDLPMPRSLRTLLDGSADRRQGLASALADRRGPEAVGALADLLVDAEREVRVAAAAALFRTVGDQLRYDPDAPESEWRRTAERLRALHNRRP